MGNGKLSTFYYQCYLCFWTLFSFLDLFPYSSRWCFWNRNQCWISYSGCPDLRRACETSIPTAVLLKFLIFGEGKLRLNLEERWSPIHDERIPDLNISRTYVSTDTERFVVHSIKYMMFHQESWHQFVQQKIFFASHEYTTTTTGCRSQISLRNKQYILSNLGLRMTIFVIALTHNSMQSV